jgi:hypothetical protein
MISLLILWMKTGRTLLGRNSIAIWWHTKAPSLKTIVCSKRNLKKPVRLEYSLCQNKTIAETGRAPLHQNRLACLNGRLGRLLSSSLSNNIATYILNQKKFKDANYDYYNTTSETIRLPIHNAYSDAAQEG